MRRKFMVISALILLVSLGQAQTAPSTQQNWVASWGTSQQIPEPQNAIPSDDLRDATERQIFH